MFSREVGKRRSITRAFVIFRLFNGNFSLSSTTVLHAQFTLALASSKYNLLRNPASLRRPQYFSGTLAGRQRRRRHIVQNRRKRRKAAAPRQLSRTERYLFDLAVHRGMCPHFGISPCRETHADGPVAHHFFVEFRLRH